MVMCEQPRVGDVPVAMVPVVVEEERWRKKSLDGKEMENPEREQRGKVRKIIIGTSCVKEKKWSKLTCYSMSFIYFFIFFQFNALIFDAINAASVFFF